MATRKSRTTGSVPLWGAAIVTLGLLAGSTAGRLVGRTGPSWVAWLSETLPVGIDPPMTVELGGLVLTAGLVIRLNVLGLVAAVLAGVLWWRLQR